MDPRFVASSKLLFDHGRDGGKAETRDYTAAELDAITDFSWPWEGLQRAIVAGLHALQGRGNHLGGRGHVSAGTLASPQMRAG